MNLATIVTGMILAAATVLAVGKMVKDRRHGGCGGDCSSCKGCDKDK